MQCTLAGKSVLVTGGNRGLGRALVEEAFYDDLGDRAVLEQHLAVNLFGPWSVTQALLPRLTRSHGAIVNVLSVVAAAALPDPMSATLAESWRTGPVEEMERQNATLVAAAPIAA